MLTTFKMGYNFTQKLVNIFFHTKIMLTHLLFTFCADTNETVSILKFMDWVLSLLLQVPQCNVHFCFLGRKDGETHKCC